MIRRPKKTSKHVERGGVIFASDWAADLVEHIWPDKLQLANENIAKIPYVRR